MPQRKSIQQSKQERIAAAFTKKTQSSALYDDPSFPSIMVNTWPWVVPLTVDTVQPVDLNNIFTRGLAIGAAKSVCACSSLLVDCLSAKY